MRSFLAALQFLTTLPIPARLDTGDFARAPFWFPVTGLLLGALTAAADAALGYLGLPPMVRAILTVALMAALTGGLHLDGLADAADGFLSARPRDRVLEIMRDSRIGAMGVLALMFVLSLKVAAVMYLECSFRWKALLLAPAGARAMQLIIMQIQSYARGEDGLAALFLRHRRRTRTLWAFAWIVLSPAMLLGPAGGISIVAAQLCLLGVALRWTHRRIGGFTGDTLGAASELSECISSLAVLVVASAAVTD